MKTTLNWHEITNTSSSKTVSLTADILLRPRKNLGRWGCLMALGRCLRCASILNRRRWVAQKFSCQKKDFFCQFYCQKNVFFFANYHVKRKIFLPIFLSKERFFLLIILPGRNWSYLCENSLVRMNKEIFSIALWKLINNMYSGQIPAIYIIFFRL